MTQIDFYILSDSAVVSGELFACKLADKAYHLKHKVYIHTAGEPQANHLDELLWTFNPGSFLPHALNLPHPDLQDPAVQTPILIGHDQQQSIMHHDVLINLTPEVPAFFSQFERVAEIVYGDENMRNAARSRYKFYRDRGYTLNTHNLGE